MMLRLHWRPHTHGDIVDCIIIACCERCMSYSFFCCGNADNMRCDLTDLTLLRSRVRCCRTYPNEAQSVEEPANALTMLLLRFALTLTAAAFVLDGAGGSRSGIMSRTGVD